MAISRRGMIGGAAGALGGLALGGTAQGTDAARKEPPAVQFPTQVATDRSPSPDRKIVGGYDMRNDLKPRRLTMLEWDMVYLLRHGPGGSMANHDRVLDEAVERGY